MLGNDGSASFTKRLKPKGGRFREDKAHFNLARARDSAGLPSSARRICRPRLPGPAAGWQPSADGSCDAARASSHAIFPHNSVHAVKVMTASGKWKSEYEAQRKYNKAWEDRFDWLSVAPDNPDAAYCNVCKLVLRPKTSLLAAHENSSKHLEAVGKTAAEMGEVSLI
jgi:hypothetical protein